MTLTTKMTAELLFGLTIPIVLYVMTEAIRRTPQKPPLDGLFRSQEVPQDWQGPLRFCFQLSFVGIGLAAAFLLVDVTSGPASPDSSEMRIFFVPWWLVMTIVFMHLYVRGHKARILAIATVALCMGLWLAFDNLLTTNLFGLTLCYVITVTFRAKKLAFMFQAAIALALGIGYDMWLVYVVEKMGTSVVTLVEAGMPFFIMAPAELSLNAPPVSGWGLGDVLAILALLVPIANISKRTGRPSLYVAAMAGMLIGDTASIVAGRVTKHWQPASMYLILGIVIAVTLVAVRTHTWRELGRPQDHKRIRQS